ncbi:MAG: glycoside hydrolase family 13 protein [Opitutales bacterium]|nr:glycoside hydrolase family 13 protein [Opitutales bacterium]
MLRKTLTSLILLAGCISLHAAPHPDWAKDVIWYQIFPERFANGDPTNDPTRDSLTDPNRVTTNWKVMDWDAPWTDRAEWEKEMTPYFHDSLQHRRYGGDLQGIIDRLDYLKDLGITGIYLNPIFYANSLHKYDGNSFHHVDPHFGPDPAGDLKLMELETTDPKTWQSTAADRLFIQLIRDARKRGIRIIIDGVWNHTGRDFFGFTDLLKNGYTSPYADWFDIISFDYPDTPENEFDYRGWHGFKSLPIFANHASGRNLADGPKQYIFDATRRWMDPNGDGNPNDGVDGWRLDVAEELPHGFWQEWHAFIREINPEVFTSAEIWGSASQYLQDTDFSSAMNYRGFAIPVKGWLIDGKTSASDFAYRLETERSSHSGETAHVLQNLIDSHDTQRVASAIANRDTFSWYKNADWFDYDDGERVNARTEGYNNGPPDEAGRRIWKMLALFQATYVGAPMIYYGTAAGMWGADDPDDRMPMRWDNIDRDIYYTYRTTLALRRQYTALRRGSFKVLETRDESQVFAFERMHNDDRFVIVLNRGNQEVALDGDYLKGLTKIYATDDRASTRRLPPLSGAIFGID